MDIIIYAQALKIDIPGDVYYKNRYVDRNRDEKINLSKFFKDIEILNYSKEKSVTKVRSEKTLKYLYLCVPCEEKDDNGRYSPIIIQAYHKDVDKIFDALDVFLENSNRHITKETKNLIKENIISFNKKIKEIYLVIFSLILSILTIVLTILL